MILNENENELIKHFNSLISIFDKIDFMVILYRLILTYIPSIQTIDLIEKIDFTEFPLVKDFFQKGRYNIFVLTLSIHYFLKKDLKKSEEFFRIYNSKILGFDVVNVSFYENWASKLEKL